MSQRIRMPVIRARLAIATAALLLIAGRPGIDAQGSSRSGARVPATAGLLVWPLPPEAPRIRYVMTYRGADDFETKKPSRWKTLLLGPDESSLRLPETMIKPYGVAVAPDGRVFVTDTVARRVFAFDTELRKVTFIGEQGNGRLTKPIGVAVDGDGRVFVADATLGRVFAYSPDGSLALAIGREGEFKSASGLAIDRLNRRLYVADASKHQIGCYSTLDGTLVRTIGQRGTEPGRFNFPTNLFVDNGGRLYVADTLNFRIQIFDAGGRVVGTFGEQGDTPGTLNRPKGVGVDSEGHVYVADTSFNNFQVFDAKGQLLLVVGGGGSRSGEFLLPAGLYVDNRDRIYVADQGNSRVQVFQYLRAQPR